MGGLTNVGVRAAIKTSDSTPNWALIVLPAALGSSAISVTASICATVLVATVVLGMGQAPGYGVKLAWPCAVLPVIALAIVLRPNYPSTTLNVLLFVMGCVAIIGAVYISSSSSSALLSLIDGTGLYLVASVVLWLVGVQGPQDRTDGLDNAITGGKRVIFPLSESLAATPAMAAVYVAAVTPILIVSRRHRVPRLVALTCAGGIFVLTDSRVSLACALIVCACVLAIPRLFRRAAPWLIAATLLLPFVYGYVQDAVGRTLITAGSYASWLVRPNEEASTLANRDQIWSLALQFYWDRVDSNHKMFGFGSYGQVESGASTSFGFTGFGSDKRFVTPHSSMLQFLFDGGWVLGGILAITMISMAWVLSRPTSRIYLAGTAMLVALSIVGSTEVALSPGHAQPTWWVLLALGTIAFARERPVSHQDKLSGASRKTESSEQAPNPWVES